MSDTRTRRSDGTPAVSKRHKFGAVPTVVDGVRFHSKAEARRYGELKLLQKAGEIRDLTLQPRFPLHAGDLDRTVVGDYVADFGYERLRENKASERITEDVKGMDTPLSRWKRRHVKAEYGIDIRIVK